MRGRDWKGWGGAGGGEDREPLGRGDILLGAVAREVVVQMDRRSLVRGTIWRWHLCDCWGRRPGEKVETKMTFRFPACAARWRVMECARPQERLAFKGRWGRMTRGRRPRDQREKPLLHPVTYVQSCPRAPTNAGHCHSVPFQINTHRALPYVCVVKVCGGQGQRALHPLCISCKLQTNVASDSLFCHQSSCSPTMKATSPATHLHRPCPLPWHSKCCIYGQKTSAAFLGA